MKCLALKLAAIFKSTHSSNRKSCALHYLHLPLQPGLWNLHRSVAGERQLKSDSRVLSLPSQQTTTQFSIQEANPAPGLSQPGFLQVTDNPTVTWAVSRVRLTGIKAASKLLTTAFCGQVNSPQTQHVANNSTQTTNRWGGTIKTSYGSDFEPNPTFWYILF